jgi:DNA invertase Pin-like site-specific DNA recombinase
MDAAELKSHLAQFQPRLLPTSTPVPKPRIRMCIYIRKSDDNTGRDKNASINKQDIFMNAWAQKNGYVVVATFTDIESGGSTTRQGLADAQQFVATKANNTSVLLVYQLDRLYRDVFHTLGVLRFLKEVRCSFASARENAM